MSIWVQYSNLIESEDGIVTVWYCSIGMVWYQCDMVAWGWCDGSYILLNWAKQWQSLSCKWEVTFSCGFPKLRKPAFLAWQLDRNGTRFRITHSPGSVSLTHRVPYHSLTGFRFTLLSIYQTTLLMWISHPRGFLWSRISVTALLTDLIVWWTCN